MLDVLATERSRFKNGDGLPLSIYMRKAAVEYLQKENDLLQKLSGEYNRVIKLTEKSSARRLINAGAQFAGLLSYRNVRLGADSASKTDGQCSNHCVPADLPMWLVNRNEESANFATKISQIMTTREGP